MQVCDYLVIVVFCVSTTEATPLSTDMLPPHEGNGDIIFRLRPRVSRYRLRVDPAEWTFRRPSTMSFQISRNITTPMSPKTSSIPKIYLAIFPSPWSRCISFKCSDMADETALGLLELAPLMARIRWPLGFRSFARLCLSNARTWLTELH